MHSLFSLLMTLPLSQVSQLLTPYKYTPSNPKRTRFVAEPRWPLLKITLQCALLPPCGSTYCNKTQVTLLNPYLRSRTVNRSPELYLMLIYEANILGYLEHEYAPHSFRIGAAAAAILPPWLIKTLGRWRSDCYELYIRTPGTIINSVPQKLAAVLHP